MPKTNKKAAKKAPAKKVTKKAPVKKAAKATPKPAGSSTGSGSARSASRGGSVPEERYAKDPKSVVMRLREKADKALTQAANAIVRAEKAGVANTYVLKLQASMEHLEATKKALS